MLSRSTVARRLAPATAPPGPSTFAFPAFATVPFLREAPDSKRNVENTYHLRNLVLTGMPKLTTTPPSGDDNRGFGADSEAKPSSIATSAASDALATANRRLLQYEDLKGFIASDELFTSVLLWNAQEGNYSQCALILARMGEQQRRPLALPVFAVLRSIALHTLRFAPQAPYSGLAPHLMRVATHRTESSGDDVMDPTAELPADVPSTPLLIGLRGQFADAHLFQRMWHALPALGVRPSTSRMDGDAADDADDDGDVDVLGSGHATESSTASIVDGSEVRLFIEEFTAPDVDASQALAALVDLMGSCVQVAMDTMHLPYLMDCVAWLQLHFGSEARRATWQEATRRPQSTASNPNQDAATNTVAEATALLARIGGLYVVLTYGLLVVVSRMRLQRQHAVRSGAASLPQSTSLFTAPQVAALQGLLDALREMHDASSSAPNEDIADAVVYATMLRAQIHMAQAGRRGEADDVEERMRLCASLGAINNTRFSSEELETFRDALRPSRTTDHWQVTLASAADRVTACVARGEKTAADSIVGFCVEEVVLDNNNAQSPADVAHVLLDFLHAISPTVEQEGIPSPPVAGGPVMLPNTCGFVLRALMWAMTTTATGDGGASGDAGDAPSGRLNDDEMRAFRSAFLRTVDTLIEHNPVVVGDVYAVALEGLMDMCVVVDGSSASEVNDVDTFDLVEPMILRVLHRLEAADAVTSESVPSATFARLASVSRDAGWCEVSIKLRGMRTMLFF